MGMKRRRGPRATKPLVGVPPGEPGAPEADPCASTWEFVVSFSPELGPYVSVDSPVSLHPEAGGVAVMIGTREIGVLADPAVPQLVDCMNRGYVYPGTVIDIDEDASRVRVRVSGTRLSE